MSYEKYVIKAQFETFVIWYNRHKDYCYLKRRQKKIKKLTEKLRKALL